MKTTEQQWGTWRDADTARGLEAYKQAGLELTAPDVHRASQQLGETAVACSQLLERVYKGNYPLDVDEADKLCDEIEQGKTHLFTLENDGGLAAMTALVEKPNPLDSHLRFAELGRSCKDPAAALSVRALLKTRVPWALDNLDQDFLYSVTRSAGARPNMPSSRGVQSVWWGARSPESVTPLVSTTTGYDYRLGRPEPFNGFVVPTDPEKWAVAVNDFTLYVPNERDKHALETVFREGTYGAAQPNIRIHETSGATVAEFVMLQNASAAAGAQYVATHEKPADADRFDLDDEYQRGAFSQKVVVEADLSSTPEGAAVMQNLYDQGWSLAGWQPSYAIEGGVSPVVTRLHPAAAAEAVAAELHAAYYDEKGLAGTRAAVEEMYATMRTNVGAAALKMVGA